MSSTSTSGWNRGASAAAKPAPKKPSTLRGLVAGGAIVLIGVIALYFVSGENDEPKADKKGSAQIAEVKPDLSERQKAEKVEEKEPEKKPFWLVDASQTNGFSEAMQRKWRHAHYPPPCYTNTTSLTESPPEYAVFDFSCENRIAAYLTIEPGQTMVGTPTFGPRFEAEFKKSCETPIVVAPDDDEKTKQLKQLMIETKIALMERVRNGEKLSDIMDETHREIQKMSAVKNEIEAIALQEMKFAASEAELDDIISAANKMLEEKGIAPITVNPIVRRNLKRRLQNLQQ